MKYDFDEIIDRRNSNAMNTDGFRQYLFGSPDIEFPYADDEFIRMWVADMEFATPPEVVDAMKERLDKRIFGYTRIFDPSYFKIFSQWTTHHYNWSCKKEHLVTSPGIIPALYELVEYICKPGEKVLIMTPSYAFFKYAADHNDLELVSSFLKEENGKYTIDFEDFEEKAKDPKTSVCIFCNPHNPSGRVWTEDELKQFGSICIENDLWVISDEIHCDLLRKGYKHIPLAKLFPEYDKIVTCMAPSKTFNLAGMMFSNIIIPNDALRSIWNKRHYPMENPLSIAAAQASYEKGYEWLDQLRDYLDTNFDFTKQYLSQHLPKARFRISEATYLAWVDIKEYLTETKDYTHFFAQNCGVLLEGGNMFVSNGDGYIRLNLACPRSLLEEGLRRICDGLNK